MAGLADIIDKVNQVVDTGIDNYAKIAQAAGSKGQVRLGAVITPATVSKAQTVGGVLLVVILLVVLGILIFGKKGR